MVLNLFHQRAQTTGSQLFLCVHVFVLSLPRQPNQVSHWSQARTGQLRRSRTSLSDSTGPYACSFLLCELQHT